jgi:hypothetical protein
MTEEYKPMRIEGVPFETGGARNVNEKKPPSPAPAESGKSSDTVSISGSLGGKELVEIANTVPAELPVRGDTVDAVIARISAGTYDEPDIQRAVAGRLVESPVLSGSANGAEAGAPVPSGTERVESARAQMSNGYYDRPEVMNAVAEKLVNLPGLGSLFGR